MTEMLAKLASDVKLPATILPTKGRLVTRTGSRHSTDRYTLSEFADPIAQPTARPFFCRPLREAHRSIDPHTTQQEFACAFLYDLLGSRSFYDHGQSR